MVALYSPVSSFSNCRRIPSGIDIGVAQYGKGDALFGSPAAEPSRMQPKSRSWQSEAVFKLVVDNGRCAAVQSSPSTGQATVVP